MKSFKGAILHDIKIPQNRTSLPVRPSKVDLSYANIINMAKQILSVW